MSSRSSHVSLRMYSRSLWQHSWPGRVQSHEGANPLYPHGDAVGSRAATGFGSRRPGRTSAAATAATIPTDHWLFPGGNGWLNIRVLPANAIELQLRLRFTSLHTREQRELLSTAGTAARSAHCGPVDTPAAASAEPELRGLRPIGQPGLWTLC